MIDRLAAAAAERDSRTARSLAKRIASLFVILMLLLFDSKLYFLVQVMNYMYHIGIIWASASGKSSEK